MNDLTNLTPQQLRQAADIQEQIQALQAQLEQLLGTPQSTSAPAEPATSGRKRRKLSPQAIANIRTGVRKRMAKQAGKAQVAQPARQPKRKFSPAAKARLAAIARARWAKVKAAGKSRL